MYQLPLPSDRPRLQTLRTWIAQQQVRTDTVRTLLDLLAERVDDAIAAAPADSGRSEHYRIQKLRIPEGRAVLHRADCWMPGGGVVSWQEAIEALADPAVKSVLQACEACRPLLDENLNAET